MKTQSFSSRSLLLLSCLPVCGCGLLVGRSEPPAAPAVAVVAAATPDRPEATAARQDPAAVGAAMTRHDLQARPDDAAFAFWRAPDFQQRFAESYLAESDYEPKVTAADRDLLVEIAELLATAPADDPAPVQDRAIERLQQRLDASSSAASHFLLGSLQFQRGRLPQAVAAYDVAVKKHGTFRRAWKNLSLVHMRSGAFAQAIVALTRTVQLGGADALTYGLLGFALGSTDDHIGAESAYRMAAMLDPSQLDYRLGLARSFFKQRRFADAAALTGTLVAAHPQRGDLWLLQANAWAGMGEYRKAAENLELVDRLGQSSADSLHLLGDIYTNEDLPDLANTAYLRAIARDPKGDPARALRAAKALAVRGAHAECRQLVEAIEKTFGDRLDAVAKKDVLKLRSRLAVAGGAGDEEARVLEQIVALDPLDGEAILLLGQYHARRGESDLAILQYERAAGIAAFEADAKVRHAQLLVGKGRYQEALPLLRRAQQVKPRENIQSFLDQVERVAQGK